MKANEVLVLSAIAVRGKGAIPPFKKLSEWTGLSVSQCFDSIESLFDARIVHPSRERLDPPVTAHFFRYALPFVLPGSILGSTRGVALALSETSATSDVSAKGGASWVWPFEEGSEEGVAVRPFHENLKTVLKNDPTSHGFFSCLEVLRFQQHPLRAQATERMARWIDFAESGAAPRPSDSDRDARKDLLITLLSRVVAETGYRSNSLTELARKTDLPVEELERTFGTSEALAQEIARACAARAGAHFGKILMARPEDRLKEAQASLASFLRFLDSNEDYFRLGLWFYVERMHERTADDSGALGDGFFEGLEALFEELPSPRSASARAAMFSSSWLSYAWFRWFEYPKMAHRDRADARLKALREVLVSCLS